MIVISVLSPDTKNPESAPAKAKESNDFNLPWNTWAYYLNFIYNKSSLKLTPKAKGLADPAVMDNFHKRKNL